jgi:glutaredoxin
MAGVLAAVQKWLPGPRLIIAIAVLAAFAALATAVYHIRKNAAGPKFVANAEYYPDGGSDGGAAGLGGIKVTMYGVKWCPHSKAAVKPWNEWKEANDGKTIGGVKISCDTVDCEANEESENKCAAAGVTGYPTVVAAAPDGTRTVMDAKTTVSSLNQFVAKVAASVASGTPLA